MTVKVSDMTDAEVIEDLAISLASEICNSEDTERQKRIRKLLIEFAQEIKQQAIEP